MNISATFSARFGVPDRRTSGRGLPRRSVADSERRLRRRKTARDGLDAALRAADAEATDRAAAAAAAERPLHDAMRALRAAAADAADRGVRGVRGRGRAPDRGPGRGARRPSRPRTRSWRRRRASLGRAARGLGDRRRARLGRGDASLGGALGEAAAPADLA